VPPAVVLPGLISPPVVPPVVLPVVPPVTPPLPPLLPSRPVLLQAAKTSENPTNQRMYTSDGPCA
jgi:hypothetical protein